MEEEREGSTKRQKKMPTVKEAEAENKGNQMRLIVVTNRLPFTATRGPGDDLPWILSQSSGGLVSALSGVKHHKITWIAWAGVDVIDLGEQNSLRNAISEEISKETSNLSLHSCIPVFLDKDLVDRYYNGFCNQILWFLLHYLGIPKEDQMTTTGGFDSQILAYEEVNKRFADVILEECKEGDAIWIHDYHFLLLPHYLKMRNVQAKVGWFLHTPFPSPEFYRILPSRLELLKAVISSDLVGFHTSDYADHFASACSHILHSKTIGSAEHGSLELELDGNTTQVAHFPIGIDYQHFAQNVEKLKMEGRISAMKNMFPGKKVILGVDRLDMIKGIPKKLQAFEKFLEHNPEWRDKVLLLQIAVPTRTDVPEYKLLAEQVHKIVGRINGKYGNFSGSPIRHLDMSVSFDDLCCLYAVTDVALVTSIRDGMNLVSYEFVACQDPKRGVLILSEFAGAAKLLRGCVSVNPWDINQVSEAIKFALDMQESDVEALYQLNHSHVSQRTAQTWADDFVRKLTQ